MTSKKPSGQNEVKITQMKKWVPAAALILLAATIVYASSKVEFKKDATSHSDWMIYSPNSHSNAGTN